MFRRRGICFWIGIACVVAGVFIILALVWVRGSSLSVLISFLMVLRNWQPG